MRRTLSTLKPSHKVALIAGLISAKLALVVLLLVVVPVVSPSTGAAVADWIRSVAGPRPVAFLEGESLAIQDSVNRFLAAHGAGPSGISLAPGAPAAARPQGALLRTSSGSNAALPASASQGDVVTALPQVGWRAFGPALNGSPVMAETLLNLDPQRPYAGIALVRIDLSKLQLHMMPGNSEPSHAPNVLQAIPNIGAIPAADQLHVIAAFNGGFKAVNGRYGMMVDSVTLLPPQNGISTVAIYKDGHVAMGVWGQDIGPSPDMLAFRQNCPPILQNGRINPQVYVDSQALWGETIGNKQVAWRTGLGLSQDGRYLIYAVGNGTSIETLARALQTAGAFNAMQLDINRPFARFVTYQQTGNTVRSLKAVPLLNEMENEPTLYLLPHYRDFFYLTAP